jgi:hypothetical protein
MASTLRTVRPRDAAGSLDEPLDWSRREIAVTIGKLAAAAMLGPILMRKGVAYGQQPPPPRDPCPGTHAVNPAHEIKLATCINANNKKKEDQAKNQTQGQAKQAAMNFAEAECAKRGPCNKECVRKGDGYTIAFVSCAQVADPDMECHKNHERWECTWQVTQISCRCK